MPFEKGQSGNPTGREKGSRNKNTEKIEQLIDTILNTETIEEIKVQVKKLIKEDFNQFLVFLAKISPKQLHAQLSAEDSFIDALKERLSE